MKVIEQVIAILYLFSVGANAQVRGHEKRRLAPGLSTGAGGGSDFVPTSLPTASPTQSPTPSPTISPTRAYGKHSSSRR